MFSNNSRRWQNEPLYSRRRDLNFPFDNIFTLSWKALFSHFLYRGKVLKIVRGAGAKFKNYVKKIYAASHPKQKIKFRRRGATEAHRNFS